MSVGQKLASFVGGDPLATAQAKVARLERKAAEATNALEAHAGREAVARVSLAQAVADDGDSKAAARELAGLQRERDALAFEAAAATEAAEVARGALAAVRERVAREEAEAALVAVNASAAKARKVLTAKLREIRELVGGTWADERRAVALATAAHLDVPFDIGLDTAAVCTELDREILAANPTPGTFNSVTLSLYVLRF